MDVEDDECPKTPPQQLSRNSQPLETQFFSNNQVSSVQNHFISRSSSFTSINSSNVHHQSQQSISIPPISRGSTQVLEASPERRVVRKETVKELPPVAQNLTPLTNDLAALFECPVCFETALPPIYQCPAGHLVCHHCRPKVRGTCPQCRQPLGNIRNRAMEQVASTVEFPCKYKINGCPETLNYKSKSEHEENCEYRPYMCPCPGASCRKQCATLNDVMHHARDF